MSWLKGKCFLADPRPSHCSDRDDGGCSASGTSRPTGSFTTLSTTTRDWLSRAAATLSGTGPQGDRNGSGLPDLIERAFGLSTFRLSPGTAPDFGFYEDGSGNRFIQAVYDPRLIPHDLEVIFETSNDLRNWDPNGANLSTSTNARGHAVVRSHIPADGSSDRNFLRCRVEQR